MPVVRPSQHAALPLAIFPLDAIDPSPEASPSLNGTPRGLLNASQVVKDNELGALSAALNGDYTLPGPGGDPIRNPDVLPTGEKPFAS